MKAITKTIWILSLISLFTDVASEMLYPVMPIYLKEIGFSVVLIGILEGLAEAVAGLSKAHFGKLSDKSGKRLPFVKAGYALSAISRPMMVMFFNPLWVFLARTADRFGKGIRTGARDAMLSDESTRETRGRVFGFHRSMDTFGAVLGPVLALIYLYYNPGEYKMLFILAFIPGLLSVLATYLLKEKTAPAGRIDSDFSFLNAFSYFRQADPTYRKLVTGLLAFTLFNSSDVFLLLLVKESGFSDYNVIALYILYNLIYALSAYPFGLLADRLGLKNVFIAGLLMFAIVYTLMPFVNSIIGFSALFVVYGLYAAACEGISKAWISNISGKDKTATAIGTYTGLQSICSLIASSLTGVIWYTFGIKAAFLSTALMTLIVAIYLSAMPVYRHDENQNPTIE